MLLVIWLLFGAFTAVIAGSKGRNWFGWLLLGCVFGIFALVAVAAMPRIDADARSPKKTCPKCAEKVQAAALVCRHCGHEFQN